MPQPAMCLFDDFIAEIEQDIQQDAAAAHALPGWSSSSTSWGCQGAASAAAAATKAAAAEASGVGCCAMECESAPHGSPAGSTTPDHSPVGSTDLSGGGGCAAAGTTGRLEGIAACGTAQGAAAAGSQVPAACAGSAVQSASAAAAGGVHTSSCAGSGMQSAPAAAAAAGGCHTGTCAAASCDTPQTPAAVASAAADDDEEMQEAMSAGTPAGSAAADTAAAAQQACSPSSVQTATAAAAAAGLWACARTPAEVYILATRTLHLLDILHMCLVSRQQQLQQQQGSSSPLHVLQHWLSIAWRIGVTPTAASDSPDAIAAAIAAAKAAAPDVLTPNRLALLLLDQLVHVLDSDVLAGWGESALAAQYRLVLDVLAMLKSAVSALQDAVLVSLAAEVKTDISCRSHLAAYVQGVMAVNVGTDVVLPTSIALKLVQLL